MGYREQVNLSNYSTTYRIVAFFTVFTQLGNLA